MLALIVFSAVVFLLITTLGSPYGHTWYSRWNG